MDAVSLSDGVGAMMAPPPDPRLRGFLSEFEIRDAAALAALARRFRGTDGVARAEAEASRWFAGLLGISRSRGALAFAAGRLAWLSAGGGQRWPDLFLSDSVPCEMASALSRALPGLLPPILATDMPSAMLEPVRASRLRRAMQPQPRIA